MTITDLHRFVDYSNPQHFRFEKFGTMQVLQKRGHKPSQQIEIQDIE